jgi:hypothetical protein
MNLHPLQKLVILISETLALVLVLLPQSLFHSFSCETQDRRFSYQSTNGRFIDNQVIVIGTAEDITDAVKPFPLSLVEECDLSYLNTRKVPGSNSIVEPEKFLMQLYEARQDVDVETIIGQIDEQAYSHPLFADPNYLTRLSALTFDPCFLPNSGGGGSGGTPYGDPYIPSIPTDIDSATKGFMRQWAFDNQGIDLPPSPGLAGSEVRVAVFDASSVRNPLPFFTRIGIAKPSPLWLMAWDYAGTTMANNHGLFVAGLIHSIAPDSDIQLIRVLNDHGCGELWALNRALEHYKSWMSAWYENLDKTVINMSLGIRTKTSSNAKEVDTLEKLVKDADAAGAIVIAAAGNDSAPTFTDPRKPVAEMQFPAYFDLVYGVTATNLIGEKSCYANKGDISAPGGDGGSFAMVDENGKPILDKNGNQVVEPCISRVQTWADPSAPGPHGATVCTDMATCDFGLISLGQTKDGPQYIYWVGTSFAAPLVSGLVALAYEEGDKDQVKCVIKNGTSPLVGASSSDPANFGIINVADSLSSSILSMCGISP